MLLCYVLYDYDVIKTYAGFYYGTYSVDLVIWKQVSPIVSKTEILVYKHCKYNSDWTVNSFKFRVIINYQLKCEDLIVPYQKSGHKILVFRRIQKRCVNLKPCLCYLLYLSVSV